MPLTTLALIIFFITFTGIIFTRLPWINIDRPSAAFFGAVAMVLFGVLSFPEAVAAVDFNTIALLLGMMIIVSTLQLDGFFSLLASQTISFSGNQRRLLSIVVFVTGIASAFMVNDAVVLVFTPVIIRICRSSGLNPIPFLIAEIFSANLGSTMTITGNPQNMLIGMSSGITYARFLWTLFPVSLAGLAGSIFVIRWCYPSVFKEKQAIKDDKDEFTYNYASMRFSLPVFALVIVLFFVSHIIGLSIPMVALAGASLILIFGQVRPSKVIRQVDWVLLLFFASLFIVVKATEKVGLFSEVLDLGLLNPGINGIVVIHGVNLLMSQIVSNVPFTILMLPILHDVGSDLLWLCQASASTLAGNATIIGAMANLIVIETALRDGVKISFREFLKPGILITLFSFCFSILVLWLALRTTF